MIPIAAAIAGQSHPGFHLHHTARGRPYESPHQCEAVAWWVIQAGCVGPPTDIPQTYEIRIRGTLKEQVVEAIGASRQETTTTVLIAAEDRAALHSVIQRIEDLDLHLISVTPVGPEVPK
jgi:hypothetical protein